MPGNLRFTGPLLADIYLGKIKRWNDPALIAVNPDVKLPDQAITVVHRSDGSGTTFNWVNYLSKVSPDWKEKVGEGTSVSWPAGVGGKGNEGVAEYVKRTKGVDRLRRIRLRSAEQDEIRRRAEPRRKFHQARSLRLPDRQPPVQTGRRRKTFIS